MDHLGTASPFACRHHAALVRPYLARYLETCELFISRYSIGSADLKQSTSITNVPFPAVPPPNEELTSASNYIRQVSSEIGSAEGAQQKRLAKGKSAFYDPKKVCLQLSLYIRAKGLMITIRTKSSPFTWPSHGHPGKTNTSSWSVKTSTA